MVRAVIYVPPGVDRAKWMSRCLDHCARRHYTVTAVIEDGSWDDVSAMMLHGRVEVVVVSQFEHLAPDRTPRVEEASDWRQPPSGRRAHTIR